MTGDTVILLLSKNSFKMLSPTARRARGIKHKLQRISGLRENGRLD
jgi:hypothetical protein